MPTITGKIDALITGGITVKVSSGCGTDHGYLHVYKTSSTTMTGLTPAVGLYVQATVASGSCSTSIVASAMNLTATAPTPAPSASASPVPAATPTPITTAAPSGSPIPLQPTKSSVSSTIDGISTNRFVLNPANGIGYMPVNTNSATVFVGAKLATGLYAQVAGTGAFSSFTGTFVALNNTAPASVTVSGTAVAATSYGFTLNTGTGYASIPIVMNAQTAVGGAPLTAGSTVKVVGTGWQSIAITAQQVVVSAPSSPATPTPAPIAQTHILTADYLGAPYGTTSVSWSAAAPYLSWAQAAPVNANAISAAGIKTQYYIDPNQAANNGDPMWSTDETAFAHDCSGNRLSFSYDNATMYQMEVDSATVQSQFATVIKQATSGAHYDLAWEDGAGVLGTVGLPAMPCNYSDPEWLQFGQSLNSFSPIPVMFNGLGELNAESPSQSMAYLSDPNTVGGNFEFCYSANSTNPKISGWVWQATENTELQVAAKNKLFECQLRNSAAASSSTDARIYAIASFFLTYNPTTSILWEEFATGSGLRVLPESRFVMLQPKVAAPASITGLQQSGGTYAREYNQCFYAGKFVGSCAVVVNADTGISHPFPFPQYTHTLVLSGGGVLDGGTVSTSGPAPPISVPQDTAIVAFP